MSDPHTPRRPIPVTVIGGYLGAGKTTCLNQLLAGDHGLRLAVLVNDFGAINIDAGLVAHHNGDTVALTNGCVCCSIADDLGTVLKAQVARPDPPDHILIEASGVAEPAKIGRLAGNWPGCTLARIVVLADATTVRARSTDKFVGSLVVRQLRDADLIAINKTDLGDDTTRQATLDWVAKIAPQAGRVETRYGVVPVELLGASERRLDRPADDAPVHHSLNSAVWTPKGSIDVEKLHSILGSMADIHRAKGIVETTAGLRLVQWSDGQFASTPSGGPATGLVVIGPFGVAGTAVLQQALAASAPAALSADAAAG